MSNQVSSGLSIAQAVLSSTALGSNSLLLAQQVAADNTKARISILAELVSAVGLQRLRFMERQQKSKLIICILEIFTNPIFILNLSCSSFR